MSDTPTPAPAHDALATRWSRIQSLHDVGAEEAWRWFIDRYHPEIRAMLRRRVPDRWLAQAEGEFWGYLYVSRAIRRAERDRRFRPYLAGIVRNFAREWLRRQESPFADDEGMSEIPTSANRELEQEELRAWARHTVLLALDSMRERHPEQVEILRHFYGLPDEHGTCTRSCVADIAARTGKSIAAVHQDLTRGRLRLRACIEQEVREQVGSATDWREEMQVIFGAIDHERPGLIPKR